MTLIKQQNNSLEGFSGWDNPEDTDLFDAPIETEDTNLLDTVKKDDITGGEEEPETPPTIEVEEEEDLFGGQAAEDSEEEKEEEDGAKAKNNEKTEVDSITLLNQLKEKGIVEFELEEGVELDQETAEDILEDSLENRMETLLDEKLDGLDPAVKNIIQYSIKGGDINELLTKMVPNPTISVTDDMDLDEESNQIALVTRDMLAKGDNQESINTYTDYLRESGKLKNMAEGLHTKFLKEDKEVAKKEAARMAKLAAAEKEKEREFRGEISSFIKDSEDIKLSVKESRDFPSYIAEKSIILQNGNKISQLQRDVLKAMQDKRKVVLLAKVLKDDFNFTALSKGIKTKQVKDIKKGLQNNKGASVTVPKKRMSLIEQMGL